MQTPTQRSSESLDGSRISTLDIVREAYRALHVYAPNTTPAAIDLSDNTNQWGAPPSALRTLQSVAPSAITLYPPLDLSELKGALAQYAGVTADMIITGCGSDDVLDCTMRAFGDPGDTLVHPTPSFGMIPLFATVNGLRPIGVPLTEAFDADVAGMLATQAKITYLCSPNNPTGKGFAQTTIAHIVDEARGLVIVDEAYAEFAQTNALALLERSPRLLVTRTLSKAFGLAGLRIGYGIGDPAIIREIEKARGPYKVNAFAAQIATAVLHNDRAWVEQHIQEAIQNRTRFTTALRELSLSPIPSDANFICVPVSEATRIDTAMRERGVAVRAFQQLPGIGDALRIAMGPWPMLDECLRVLREVL